MANRTKKKTNQFQKQLEAFWKKTQTQFEQITKALMKSSGLDKLRNNGFKILAERDRLLKKLGEETYKLIDQRKIKVPKPVQDIYLKLRGLMDRLIIQKPARRTAKRKTAKATTARRKTTKRRAARA